LEKYVSELLIKAMLAGLKYAPAIPRPEATWEPPILIPLAPLSIFSQLAALVATLVTEAVPPLTSS